MTSVIAVKKQVEKIKQKIMPEHKQDIVIVFAFGVSNEEPHGKYGYRKLHIFEEHYVNGQRYEAPSEEEEMRYMRKAYDELPKHAKRKFPASNDLRAYSWATFEDFKEYHKCHCGRFGHE